MPTFRITGPDGNTYRITAPEGATPEQALERVRSMAGGGTPAPAAAPAAPQDASGGAAAPAPVLPQPPAAPAAPTGRDERGIQLDQRGVPYDVPVDYERPPQQFTTPTAPDYTADREAEKKRVGAMGLKDRLMYGGAAPLHNLMLNIQQLGGQDVTRDVERLRAGVEGAGTAGTIGNTLTNIAATAVPAGKIQSGLAAGLEHVLPKLPMAIRAALAAGGSSAAMEAATNAVGEGETRLGNSAKAGATAGALDLGLRGVGKVLTGLFTPNADAKKLIAEGVTPPLSHATDNPAGKALGKATETVTTFVDSNMAPSRLRADQQTVAAMVRRASPPGAAPASVGSDIRQTTAQTLDQLDSEYNKVLAKKFVRIDNQFATRARRIVDTAQGVADQKSKDVAHDVLATYFQPGKRWAARNFNSRLAPDFDAEIARLERSSDPTQARAAKILREVQPLVRQLRNRNLASQGVAPDVIEGLDDAYRTAMRLKDASAASEKSVGVGATELNRSVQKGSTSTQFARGEAPDQDLTDVASRVIHPTEKGNPLYNLGIRGLAYGAAGIGGGPMGPAALWAGSRAVQSEPGHKFLLGMYGKQKTLADLIRQYAPGGAAIQQALDQEN